MRRKEYWSKGLQADRVLGLRARCTTHARTSGTEQRRRESGCQVTCWHVLAGALPSC